MGLKSSSVGHGIARKPSASLHPKRNKTIDAARQFARAVNQRRREEGEEIDGRSTKVLSKLVPKLFTYTCRTAIVVNKTRNPTGRVSKALASKEKKWGPLVFLSGALVEGGGVVGEEGEWVPHQEPTTSRHPHTLRA